MKYQKPKAIKKGDTIGLISPASSPSDLSRIESAVKYFEGQGYRVEVGRYVGKFHGYLAGKDKERLTDLHYMFESKKINAVLCIRGGYGTPRLLKKINYDLIKKNPKIFVGYSDITALQMAFLHKAKLHTFAGPMPAVDFAGDVSPYAEEHFWRALTDTKGGNVVPVPENHELGVINDGKAQGRIIGGNLALVASLLCTKYLPKVKNRILVLEEVGEYPFRVDRMLNQLKLSGMLKLVSGVILGQFTNCVAEEGDRTLTIDQLFKTYFKKLKVPVITNFPHGHVDDTYTIPFGTRVSMNAKKGIIKFLDAGVK